MRITFLCLALSILAPAPAAGPNAAPGFQPTFADGVPVPATRGVWKSRGYGWIVELTDKDVIVHHVSKAGCSTDPRKELFKDQFAYHLAGQPAGRLVAATYPGENRYVFERLPQLPASCREGRWTPTRLFDHFVASYREQYAFFKQHGVDWEARVRANRPLVTDRTTPRVLFAIMSDMLEGLGDAHVGMNATIRGDALIFRTGRGKTMEWIYSKAEKDRTPSAELRDQWTAAYNRGIRDQLLGGRFQEAAAGRILWGRIGNDIGYINLTRVEGFAPGSLADNVRFVNDAFDRILGEFEGVRAVILDISYNTGGYDRLAREIAGHFAERRLPAYSKRPFGAEDLVDSFYTEPSAGRRFLGPTYLVTSDITASGGEILAMSMRVLPNVTQVGTPTRGALSDRLIKVMPNGWDFSISNEIYLDPEARLFEGTGVPPHRPLELFAKGDLKGGHVQALSALVADIRAGRAARARP